MARGHRHGSPHFLPPVPPTPTRVGGSRGTRSGDILGSLSDGDQECLTKLANAVFKDKLLLVGARNRCSRARACVCCDSFLRCFHVTGEVQVRSFAGFLEQMCDQRDLR